MTSPTQNLLILMSDEHQAQAMGCAGHPFVQTPNLDRLAAQGLRFTNAYTPSPICVPARASFATGLWTHQTRLWDNAMPYTGAIRGWGHVLQEAGIPVESIGKLHYRDPEDPAGFDREHLPMMVVDGVGMVWASIRNPPIARDPKGRMLGDDIGAGESKYTEYDRAVTQRTLDWLRERAERDDGQPWCLYVGLVAPHFPLVVPQEFMDLYPLDYLPPVKLHPSTGYEPHPWPKTQADFMDTEGKFQDEEERLAAIAAYYGLCSFLDHNVGQILQALEDSGPTDRTTVIYTSDHGDNVGARGMWGKSNFYEESVAIPLIISGTEVPTGQCATPVNLIDCAPTILEHFRLRDAEIESRPGKSLYAIAAEPDEPERVTFSEYHAAGSATAGFMLRKGCWKYTYYVGHEPELFGLESDPEELTDLAGQSEHAATQAGLHQELLKICDPEATDALAHADQEAMIERYGGKEKAMKLGAPAATPPPVLLS